MKKYSVSEVEAANILNGHHVAEYVHKYERIRTLTPVKRREQVGKKNPDDA